MKRIALAALPLLLALGCTAPQPSGTPTATREPTGTVRDGRGPICATDLQSCGRDTACCSGLVCQPAGRYGQLCQRPWP
jgi:hypothetical protein